MQARNLTTNVPKILDLKSSSEQVFSKNCRWVPPYRASFTHLISSRPSRGQFVVQSYVYGTMINWSR